MSNAIKASGATLLFGALALGQAVPATADAQLLSRNRALFGQDANDLGPRVLRVMNGYRAQVRVPPLQWDERLAASARAYAPRLAAYGALVHSPRGSRPNVAETLWMGPRGQHSPETMVGYWAEQRRVFRAGIFPNVSATGDWRDVSHYSQMIWPTTTHVGCALQRGGRSDHLICHYSPKGNRDGRRVP